MAAWLILESSKKTPKISYEKPTPCLNISDDFQVVCAKLAYSVCREASDLSNKGQKCAIILKTGSPPWAGTEIADQTEPLLCRISAQECPVTRKLRFNWNF